MSTKLPPDFKKYFWDCDFNSLTLEEYPDFIIERIASLGDIKALRWLFDHLSREKIKNVIMNSRRMDKRTVNFWRIYFEEN